jgi:GNAT superfamily N-acetyltransferase
VEKEISAFSARSTFEYLIVTNLEWNKEEFAISTDKSRLQIDAIQDYLTNQSYWAKERTPEQTRAAIENSICFGLYEEDRQIGFARVVTDMATFAYLGDVFVLPEYQGKGLGRWMMEVVIGHPELQGFRRWVLATRDAHTLYEKYGFTGLKHPDRWMEKAAPNAY